MPSSENVGKLWTPRVVENTVLQSVADLIDLVSVEEFENSTVETAA